MKKFYLSQVTGAQVLGDKDWQEVVVVPKGGKIGGETSYHTDDEHAAINTADMMEAAA
jgi:hypothetical protein